MLSLVKVVFVHFSTGRGMGVYVCVRFLLFFGLCSLVVGVFFLEWPCAQTW